MQVVIFTPPEAGQLRTPAVEPASDAGHCRQADAIWMSRDRRNEEAEACAR